MSKLLVSTLALAAALVAVPAALAKGPFEVCGAGSCATLSPETRAPVRLGVDAATPRLAPPAPAPYFSIRFRDFPGSLVFWVPSASALRLAPTGKPAFWVAALPAETELLRTKTAALAPRPAPKAALVAVDGVRVRDGASYLRLFTAGTPVAAATGTGGWLPLWVLGGASPWNDGQNAIRVSRRGGFLERDGQLVRIPTALAERIRARLPLDG